MRLIRNLFWDTHAGVLILTSLTFMLLVVVAGMGVDLGRQQMVRIHAQEAADAASVAGALEPDVNKRAEVARRYFTLNYPPNYLGVPTPTPQINLANGVEVTAQATVPTIFLQFAGVTSMQARGRSVVVLDNGALQQGQDFILLMDNSLSMNQLDMPAGSGRNATSGVEALALAACNNLAWVKEVTPIYPSYDPCDDFGLTGNTRLNGLRQAATTMVNTILPAGNSVNRVAMVTWSELVLNEMAFTTHAAQAQPFLDRMFALGGTNSHFAMQKAQTLAANFDPTHVKAVVLLTDGMNTSQDTVHYISSSRTYSDGLCNGGTSYPRDYAADHCSVTDTRTLAVCNEFKNKGYFVFTISFSVDSAEQGYARSLLRSCASDMPDGSDKTDHYYFEVPDADALTKAFASIYQTTTQARISE